MNLLDLGILSVTLVCVVRGIRRGFVLGAIDILGFVFIISVGLLGYRGLARVIEGVADPGIEVAQLVAFFGLLVLATFLYSLAANSALGRFRAQARRSWVSAALGAVPGFLQGSVVAVLIVLALSLLPLNGSLIDQTENSLLAPYYRRAASRFAPRIQALVTAIPTGALTGVNTPGSGNELTLRFPRGLTTTVDAPAEARMLELINRDRVKEGLSPLRMDAKLQEVARAHSREMFRLSYFAHESPRTGAPADRLRRANIPFLVAGENLAYQPNVDIAHRELMESPGHRKNILSPVYKRVGIGVIRGGLYGEMFTQEFTD